MDANSYLMCKDVVVAEMFSDKWNIVRANLLPKNFNLVYLNTSIGIEEVDRIFDDTTVRPMDTLQDWCATRVLSIDRIYAKKVLNALGLSQGQSNKEKARVALSCRALSLCDSYWLKFSESSEIKWKDISLRHNSLSKSIALIALAGTSMTLQVKSINEESTAEIATLGSYAKGWFRNTEGILELHKAKGYEGDEVDREVGASTVIDCFNCYGNVKYTYGEIEGIKTSKCRLMTTDDKAIVHAADMQSWCLRNGTDVVSYAKKHYLKEFSQMVVIDYLLANSDRHSWNWGFWQDMNTGKILGLHDLYDHNNCFDREALEREDYKSLVIDGKSLKESALYFIKHSDLKLIKEPKSYMFPSKVSFKVFIERCKQLGLWIFESKGFSLSSIFKIK